MRDKWASFQELWVMLVRVACSQGILLGSCVVTEFQIILTQSISSRITETVRFYQEEDSSAYRLYKTVFSPKAKVRQIYCDKKIGDRRMSSFFP